MIKVHLEKSKMTFTKADHEAMGILHENIIRKTLGV
jgi:hypothetical protein